MSSYYPNWIEERFLNLNWHSLKNSEISRLCDIRAIAIHYTAAPKQTAYDIVNFFNTRAGEVKDLTVDEQANPIVGTHFVIDDNRILALAPTMNYMFYHVGDNKFTSANSFNWNKTRRDIFIRSNANYYTVGIEHCHDKVNGKFSKNVLKNSHKLVWWIQNKIGAKLLIGRHYDFTGKACPLYYSPVLKGNRVEEVFEPEFETTAQEIKNKNNRWAMLLAYYKQSNPNNIPTELL